MPQEDLVRVEGKKRILTGIRPTGPLHLGHYAGALENWVSLQTSYDCCFLIADYQVSDYADDLARVREAVWEVALDWLAVGLDPERSSFAIESLIPEHAELTLWLSWFLPLGMLQRNPTLKAEMEAFGRKSGASAVRSAIREPASAEAIVRGYPVGHQVAVFYNPSRPDDAVLVPGGSRGNWFFLLFGCALFVASVVVLLRQW